MGAGEGEGVPALEVLPLPLGVVLGVLLPVPPDDGELPVGVADFDVVGVLLLVVG